MPPGGGPYPASYGQPPPPGYTTYDPYGGGSGVRRHPQGTTILVLGILAFFCFGFILGPIAWILGQKAMTEINSNPSITYTNRGQVNAGRICGIVATCITVLVIVIVIASK